MNKRKLLKQQPKRLTISFNEDNFHLYDYVIKKAGRTRKKYSAIIQSMIEREKKKAEYGNV